MNEGQLSLLPTDDRLRDTRNTTSFVNNMSLPVHRWFRYSAGFSAEWVRSLLKEPEESRVLDPFAGSGTTLLAAQECGARSIGVDSHPFVSRVAQAKLQWWRDPQCFERQASSVLHEARPVKVPADTPKLLHKCYHEDVLQELLGLRDVVLGVPDDWESKDLIWLAFVAIVRVTSHVGTAQWQYVLPNKRKGRSVSVRDAFLTQVAAMREDMTLRQRSLGTSPVSAHYSPVDARSHDLAPQGWATHVICSPPYANNYDYADATRLEQTVLGEVQSYSDLKGVRSNLIRSCSQHMSGFDPEPVIEDPDLAPIRDELLQVYNSLSAERLTRGGRKAYHSMVLAYFRDLSKVWHRLRAATASGASVCFVVGDSAPYGVYVPVDRWLGELAVSVGFASYEFEKTRDRNIKWKNRKHRVPLHEGYLWVRG